MNMKGSGNTRLQDEFVKVMSVGSPIGYKQIQLDVLLSRGFSNEVNLPIPSISMTPLLYCVQTLSDEELPLIEALLPYADLSQRDSFGLTVFDALVPVRWQQKEIFYTLLEALEDESRAGMILRSAATADSVLMWSLRERVLRAEWGEYLTLKFLKG